MYKEFDVMTWQQGLMFGFGIVLAFSGVYLICANRKEAMEFNELPPEEKLGRIQAQQREAIATKANDFDTQERHEALVAETKEGAKSLHDRAEQLGTSINAVEEQLAQLSNLTQHKAEAHEVDEVLRQNDAVQGQVSALKGLWMLAQDLSAQTDPVKLRHKIGERAKAWVDLVRQRAEGRAGRAGATPRSARSPHSARQVYVSSTW